jgi:hypothetical protein
MSARREDFDGSCALSGRGKVNVLASPTVSALNNEPAIMRVLTHDVFFKANSVDVVTDGSCGERRARAVYRRHLARTPRITRRGVISLSIAPSLTGGRPGRSLGRHSAHSGERGADTLVRPRDNETAVIAGCSTSVYGMMCTRCRCSRSAGIGAMFRDKMAIRHKSDLVILRHRHWNGSLSGRGFPTQRDIYENVPDSRKAVPPDARPEYLFKPSRTPMRPSCSSMPCRREGFVVVTGDIGTGRRRCAGNTLEQTTTNTFTALVRISYLGGGPAELILQDFGVISREDVMLAAAPFVLERSRPSTTSSRPVAPRCAGIDHRAKRRGLPCRSRRSAFSFDLKLTRKNCFDHSSVS